MACVLVDRLHGKSDAFSLIDGEAFDIDPIVFIEVVGDFIASFVTDFRDVEESVSGPEEVDEGPEVSDSDDFSVIDGPDNDFSGDVMDTFHGGIESVLVAGCDADDSVVIDIDTSSGDFDNLPNDSPSRAYDVTNFFFSDGHGGDFGCVV